MVDLAGRLELSRESQRIESLVEVRREGIHKVILDMTRVNFIDSTGLGLIALASGRMKQSAGRLIVVAPAGKVLHMLETTQVITIVTVRPTLEEDAREFGR